MRAVRRLLVAGGLLAASAAPWVSAAPARPDTVVVHAKSIWIAGHRFPGDSLVVEAAGDSVLLNGYPLFKKYAAQGAFIYRGAGPPRFRPTDLRDPPEVPPVLAARDSLIHAVLLQYHDVGIDACIETLRRSALVDTVIRRGSQTCSLIWTGANQAGVYLDFPRMVEQLNRPMPPPPQLAGFRSMLEGLAGWKPPPELLIIASDGTALPIDRGAGRDLEVIRKLLSGADPDSIPGAPYYWDHDLARDFQVAGGHLGPFPR